MMEAFKLDPAKVRDISSLLLDKAGKLRVVSANELSKTTPEERLLFGMLRGFYSFPTEELVCFLRERIAGRRAIEIGAGHGVLADALGIPATDSRQQENASVSKFYRALGQSTVPYGANVEKLSASEAVALHKPQVVIACWVTHRFDPRRPAAGGNEAGVDEASIVASCDEYVFIGNEQVHQHKPIWALPHEGFSPEWLYSRAINGSRDFISIWAGQGHLAVSRSPLAESKLDQGLSLPFSGNRETCR